MPRAINPQTRNRYTRAFGWIPASAEVILDLGCGDGRFIGWISGEGIGTRWYGCDVDPQAIEDAKQAYPHVHFNVVVPSQGLPYEDACFDVVVMLGVLEYVPDELETIREIARVLKPGGTLILSVAHKGAMSWIPGNLRQRISWRYGNRREGEVRITEAHRQKLQDIANRHPSTRHFQRNLLNRHYSPKDLSRITEPYFQGMEWQRFGVLVPVWNTMNYMAVALIKRESRLVSALWKWDQAIELGPLSFYVIIKAIRR